MTLVQTRREAGRYHAAMCACPGARQAEFDAAVAACDVRDGDVMVDFPSAGGYLVPALRRGAARVEYHAIDDDPVYPEVGTGVRSGRWDSLPFAAATVDVVLSLAAIHHVIEGRDLFYRECARILRPGGRLALVDVAAGTPVATFLDGFVGAHSPGGHDARYIDPVIDLPAIESAGFHVRESAIRTCPWDFHDKGAAIGFCRDLFRLGPVDDAVIWQALQADLGAGERGTGVELPWQLAFIRAEVR